MSAETNKEVARRFTDAFNNGDVAALDEIVAEDYRQHNPQIPDGREGVKMFIGLMHGAFPDLHVNIEDMIAEDNKVVVRWTMTGTQQGEVFGVPASGRQVNFGGVDIWRVADGKAVEHWDNVDMMTMMMQLGAMPAPMA